MRASCGSAPGSDTTPHALWAEVKTLLVHAGSNDWAASLDSGDTGTAWKMKTPRPGAFIAACAGVGVRPPGCVCGETEQHVTWLSSDSPLRVGSHTGRNHLVLFSSIVYRPQRTLDSFLTARPGSVTHCQSACRLAAAAAASPPKSLCQLGPTANKTQ